MRPSSRAHHPRPARARKVAGIVGLIATFGTNRYRFSSMKQPELNALFTQPPGNAWLIRLVSNNFLPGRKQIANAAPPRFNLGSKIHRAPCGSKAAAPDFISPRRSDAARDRPLRRSIRPFTARRGGRGGSRRRARYRNGTTSREDPACCGRRGAAGGGIAPWDVESCGIDWPGFDLGGRVWTPLREIHSVRPEETRNVGRRTRSRLDSGRTGANTPSSCRRCPKRPSMGHVGEVVGLDNVFPARPHSTRPWCGCHRRFLAAIGSEKATDLHVYATTALTSSIGVGGVDRAVGAARAIKKPQLFGPGPFIFRSPAHQYLPSFAGPEGGRLEHFVQPLPAHAGNAERHPSGWTAPAGEYLGISRQP